MRPARRRPRRWPRRGDRRDDGDAPLDVGLQVERTRLAWGRTGLAFVAAGALLLHTGLSAAAPPDAALSDAALSGTAVLMTVSGLVLVASGVVTYVLGRRRHLDLGAAVRSGDTVTSAPSLRVVAVCVTAAALLGLAAVTF